MTPNNEENKQKKKKGKETEKSYQEHLAIFIQQMITECLYARHFLGVRNILVIESDPIDATNLQEFGGQN